MNSRDKIISENLVLKRERKQICVNKLRPEYCLPCSIIPRSCNAWSASLYVGSLPWTVQVRALSRINYIITKSIYI